MARDIITSITGERVNVSEVRSLEEEIEKLKVSNQEARHKKEAENAYKIAQLKEKYESNFNDKLLKEYQDQMSEVLDYLSKYERDLAVAGIKFTTDQEKKALDQFNKKQQVEKIAAMKRLQEEEKKLRKQYAESVLEDPNASKEEKKQAKKDIIQSKRDEASQKLQQELDSLPQKLADNLSALNKKVDAAFNTAMESYASLQSSINTRTQGAKFGDKWNNYASIQTTLTNAVGVTPYIKTQKLMENLTSLVDEGIVYNLEQRAFLQTISDKIATTFDAANGTLLRLVRLQQSDSTAARLGLEARLTSYLNSMFQNTEYLNNNFDNVSTALLEASSQMLNEQSIAFEYTVQKWLGSLASVGLSDQTISSLANAIGNLGSGNIQGLASNEGMQNLIVMASSAAGLNYADMLTNGLNESNTNKLLESVVRYLQEIANTNNQVIKSQYASTFGINVSDLTAALNLREKDLGVISKEMMTYSTSIKELGNQLSDIGKRLSLSEMLSNVYDNSIYSMGSTIAKNPATYALWRIASLVEDLTGGINIPFVTALGNGVDVNATVTQLMKLGVVGAGSLGMIGDIVSGVGNTVDPTRMLTALNITEKATTTSRGSGLLSLGKGLSTSSSGFIGNSSGTDIADYILADVDKNNQQKLDDINNKQTNYVEEVYKYLTDSFDKKIDVITSSIDHLKPNSSLLTVNMNADTSEETIRNIATHVKESIVTIAPISTDTGYADKISSIDSNVLAIYNLLKDGIINVNIDNLSSTDIGF